ncbi:hypothetical protein N7486_003980 [Penicillium sp. IBT 16267x]|nr:hypothetical protein N7486_003980 [Penicillium sp. IBT 16267x]
MLKIPNYNQDTQRELFTPLNIQLMTLAKRLSIDSINRHEISTNSNGSIYSYIKYSVLVNQLHNS